MKSLLVSLSLALAAVSLATAPLEAEARRLGGGRPAGMQRQAPAKPAESPNAPAQPGNTATAPTAGAAATAGAGTAAAAGKRSWMGPVAGLAAGLGIAALMSHLGLGAGFANFLTMLLLAVVLFVAVRWLMRRMAAGGQASTGTRLAGAGAPAHGFERQASPQTPELRPAAVPSRAPETASGADPATRALPAGFDAEDFERIAKMIFIRLQAANDSAQVEDLRKFTTPELFASLRLDLQERGDARQQTDVLQLDAKLLETTQEGGQWIATVRFSGLIREEAQAAAEPFDEMWHLVKPVDGSREWAIAGITPTH